MAVFDIDIVEHDGQVGEFFEGGDFHLADLHRCAQVLVGFTDELLNDAVFEEEDGGNEAYDHDCEGH